MKPIRIKVIRTADRRHGHVWRACLANDRSISASAPQGPEAAARRLAIRALLPKMPSAVRAEHEARVKISALDAAKTEFIAQLT